MRENKISSIINPHFKVRTTDSNHDRPIAPRLFETGFAGSVMAHNHVYVGDITYVSTEEGNFTFSDFYGNFYAQDRWSLE